MNQDNEKFILSSNPQGEGEKSVNDVYYFRVLPVLAGGMALWLISTLSITSISVSLSLGGYIGAFIGYMVLWIISTVLAMKHKNWYSAIVFLIASYVNGIVQAPIVVWASSYLGSFEDAKFIFLMASSLSVVAVAGGLAIGALFKDRIKSKWYFVAIMGVMIVGSAEWIISFFVPASYGSWIYWTSAIYLAFFMVTVIYDGTRLESDVQYAWMLAVLKIFIDFVILTVRIFILIVSALADSR